MKQNNNTNTINTVHAAKNVHAIWTWTHDRRYPSGRCIPVHRTVRFNPRGR